MEYKFSQRSIDKLKDVHPALVAVTWLALKKTPHDFGITEGLRSLEQQKANVAKGVSQTMRSKHLTGHAIDFKVYVGGELTWDLKYYKEVADAFFEAAKELGIEIVWGGNWKTLVDGPHIEIDPNVWK